MKKYSVKVYHFIERFQDEYLVFAMTKAQALIRALTRISTETDFNSEDFEILEIKEVK